MKETTYKRPCKNASEAVKFLGKKIYYWSFGYNVGEIVGVMKYGFRLYDINIPGYVEYSFGYIYNYNKNIGAEKEKK